MSIPRAPLGYQQITTLSASTALAVPTGASYAMIRAESQAVRFRDDGGVPSATVGQVLAIGDVLPVNGNAILAALRFIETTASAKLNILYYA